MRKQDEMADRASCLNKAEDDEWIFVLLGRDRAACKAVEAWIKERVRLGLNRQTDPQIRSAEEWVNTVYAQQVKEARLC